MTQQPAHSLHVPAARSEVQWCCAIPVAQIRVHALLLHLKQQHILLLGGLNTTSCNWNYSSLCVILGCRREVDENCVLLGYYAASSGNSLPTFRDNLSILSSRVKNLYLRTACFPLNCYPKSQIAALYFRYLLFLSKDPNCSPNQC